MERRDKKQKRTAKLNISRRREEGGGKSFCAFHLFPQQEHHLICHYQPINDELIWKCKNVWIINNEWKISAFLFFHARIVHFSALLYPRDVFKSAQSGCYFHFIYISYTSLHSRPARLFTLHLIYSNSSQSEKSTSNTFVLPLPACLSSFFLPPFPLLRTVLFLCLNLLSLMSPSRESQGSEKKKKVGALTEIDVWALPLIRWLNPSINMQRRCPMQMDPIRRNGVVLSVCCGEW